MWSQGNGLQRPRQANIQVAMWLGAFLLQDSAESETKEPIIVRNKSLAHYSRQLFIHICCHGEGKDA